MVSLTMLWTKPFDPDHMSYFKLPRSQFFATPKDLNELLEFIERFHGSERTIAMTSAMMALNLSRNLAKQYAKEKEVNKGVQNA